MKSRIEMLSAPNDGTRTLPQSITIPCVADTLARWVAVNPNHVLIGDVAVGYYGRPYTSMELVFLGTDTTTPDKFDNQGLMWVDCDTNVTVHVINPTTAVELKAYVDCVLVDGTRVATSEALCALALESVQIGKRSPYTTAVVAALLEGNYNLVVDSWPVTEHSKQVLKAIKFQHDCR